MQKLTGLFIIITVLLTILAVGYIWQSEQEKAALRSQLVPAEIIVESPNPSLTPEEAAYEAAEEESQATPAARKQTGSITGSLSFPSSGIPENMEVCAENVTTQQLFCTSEHLKGDEYTYGFGYDLELPLGKYFVYAKLPNDPYKAYYSEFVTCGLSVECESHLPLSVEVTEGVELKNIDPQDWYNN